jgi:PhnB protein
MNIPGLEAAKRIFQLLSEGGKVHLPFAETFWAPGFGVVIDRFGIPWEINSNTVSESA